MATWVLKPADDAASERIVAACGLPRAIARSLVLRGYDSPETVNRFLAFRESLDYLGNLPMTQGLERAVARIRQAKETGEKVTIYGDYDADGVTSTSLLYRYLRNGMGLNVEAFLPNRFRDGYGVTAHAIRRLAEGGTRLVVTCDNGISAHAAADAAREAGIDLIVTDHHQVPEQLPDAHAIVHPAIEIPALRDLAGVGVAYLLAIALEGRYSDRMPWFLDFVTIGTVADMVPLNGPNRPLVWAGLQRFRGRKGGSPIPGIQALAQVAKVEWEAFSARDIGFSFGPRINAAGRLDDPTTGFRLFTTKEPGEAEQAARELEALNQERKALNVELESRILADLEAKWDFDAEPFVVLADESYHHGITGIVAGRIKERFRVPVLLFSGHGEGLWKASGRSPEGCNLYDSLHAVREHLVGFGGHAQAAGASAERDRIPALRKALNDHLRDIGWQRSEDRVELDAELPFGEATPELLEQLDRLEPFGQKNPAPLFGLMEARVISRKVVKDRHLFVELDDGRTQKLVKAWGLGHEAERMDGWVRVAYRLQPSTFTPGTLDAVAVRLEPREAPLPIELPSVPRVKHDRRGDRPEDVLAEVAATDPDAVVVGDLPDGTLKGMKHHPVQRPFKQVPEHLVVVGAPPTLAEWERWEQEARLVTLVAEPVQQVEAPFREEELQVLYARLLELRHRPLSDAMAALPEMPTARKVEALRIFREAGLCVVKAPYWQLLAATFEVIQLERLSSWMAHREAVAFRQSWRETTPSASPAAPPSP